MFDLPFISPIEFYLSIGVTLLIIVFFIVKASLSRNLYLGNWWARTFLMWSWRKKTSGIENRATWEENGLPAAEKELCDYYLTYARATDRRTFKNASEWLKLTGQSGIRPTPLWIWVVLFVLTIGEAMGTGLLLAGSVSDSVTGNEIAPIGFVLATILAFGLLWFTHTAGKEAAFSNAIKSHMGNSVATERFGVRKMSPTDDYRIDDGVDPSRRFANRALNGDHDRAKRWARITTGIILTCLVLAIFAIRVMDNRHDYDNSVLELPQNTACTNGSSSTPGSTGTNPFANMSSSNTIGSSIPGFSSTTTSPPSVNCDSQQATNRGRKDSIKSLEESKDIAAGVLALLYIIVQFIGFVVAMKYSFYNDEGYKAFSITQGYLSYDELYRDRLEPVYKLANSALQTLRNHLIHRVNKYRDNPSRMDFQQYCMRQRYNADSDMTSDELDEKLGREAYIAAKEYRQNLRKMDSSVDICPLSLEKYGEIVEYEARIRKNNREIKLAQDEVRKDNEINVTGTNHVIDTAPISVKSENRSQVQATSPTNILGSLEKYDILDVEAAQEMMEASSVLERKQILDALSQGDQEKKVLLQEIYKILKEKSNG